MKVATIVGCAGVGCARAARVLNATVVFTRHAPAHVHNALAAHSADVLAAPQALVMF